MTSASSNRVLITDQCETSTLNPNAPVFIPSYAHAIIESSEAMRIDQAMACFHHLATVNDTETLNQAKVWLGEDPTLWFDNGMDYMCPDRLDETTERYCDYEDMLRDQLYQPPQRAKGDTRTRMRVRKF